MRIGIVHTLGSVCRCAESATKGLETLGHQSVLVNSEEIELRAYELGRECDLIIDHTDTFEGQGLCRALVRMLLENHGARIVGSDSRACLLADDKIAAKAKLAEAGISTPPGIVGALHLSFAA
jgi:glutathione synthase/RimK-type ligase-like ATP-grasp enzyme